MIPDTLTIEIRRQLRTDVDDQLLGWTGPDRGIELANLVWDLKPKVCVEIGVFGGRSAIAVGLALLWMQQDDHVQRRIYAIDPWKIDDALEGENNPNKEWAMSVDYDVVHAKCMKAIWKNKLEGIVIPIRAPSQFACELFPEGSIDFANIDGNHSQLASVRDLHHYLHRIRSGGIIHFDDSEWPSTQMAVKMLRDHCDVITDSLTHVVFRKR